MAVVKTARRIIDDAGVGLPLNLAAETSKTITSITRSGVTATLTATAHGFSNSDVVYIDGVFPAEYNGVFVISNVQTNTFDYTMVRDPGASASVGSAVVWRGTLGTELDLTTALGANLLGRITNGATGPTAGLNILLGKSNDSVEANFRWRSILTGDTGNLVGTEISFGIATASMYINVFAYGNTGQSVDLLIAAEELTSV